MQAKVVLVLAATCAASLSCSQAHAKRPAHGVAVATDSFAPYSVDLVDEHGRTLDTYEHRGRFYVRGDAGERYTIRVSNPTARRVEAVISVDGLDVIDGETANLGKRGYVIPAYGTLSLDGYRVSTSEVASFRFSSVANSYAGRKGKARNVGVIGVAFFAERDAPAVILPEPRPMPGPRPRPTFPSPPPHYDLDSKGADRSAPAGEAEDSGAPRRSTGEHRPSPPPHPPESKTLGRIAPRPSERPGLGTAWGERRYSAVSFTRFVRVHPTRPTAMSELRYNDAPGLQALGIVLHPTYPDHDELTLRETANPFPGFAEPPPRY